MILSALFAAITLFIHALPRDPLTAPGAERATRNVSICIASACSGVGNWELDFWFGEATCTQEQRGAGTL